MISSMAASAAGSSVADTLYSLGYALLRDERWGDAADVLRAMVLAVPTDERGWVALGSCHEQLGQTSVAIQLYALACLPTRGSVRCRLALARALRSVGRDAEADEALEAAAAAAERRDDEELHELVAAESRVA